MKTWPVEWFDWHKIREIAMDFLKLKMEIATAGLETANNELSKAFFAQEIAEIRNEMKNYK